jgi:hypothetical protein
MALLFIWIKQLRSFIEQIKIYSEKGGLGTRPTPHMYGTMHWK